MKWKQAARNLVLRFAPIASLVTHGRSLSKENEILKHRLTAIEHEYTRLRHFAESLAPEHQGAMETFARAEDLLKNTILDLYVNSPPTPDLPLKIFEGQWASHIPGFGFGKAKLFDDGRIKWLEQQFGGFKNKHILELGPLEGGHTYMMANSGAASITAIESNTNAFLKCLIIKNIFDFKANFLLGDFRSYLHACQDRYDFLLASGILYHMPQPVELLEDVARVSDSFGLWTHYFDEKKIRSIEYLRNKFDFDSLTDVVGSRKVVSCKYSYLDALNYRGFCGGSAPFSRWLTRDSLLGVIEDLGFKIAIGEETQEHPNGPAILLFASR